MWAGKLEADIEENSSTLSFTLEHIYRITLWIWRTQGNVFSLLNRSFLFCLLVKDICDLFPVERITALHSRLSVCAEQVLHIQT